MKRIKHDDIQKSIDRYMKQRNYSLFNSTTTTTIPTSTSVKNEYDNLNEMALNELSLIESSISDYYLYSTASSQYSVDNYLKQYYLLINFVKRSQYICNDDECKKLLFAIFVYISIDLISHGHSSVEKFINNYANSIESELSSDEDGIVKALLLFNKNKDITKCDKLNSWKENKYQVKLMENSWLNLLKFLKNTNVCLIYRIINMNIQVNITKNCMDGDNENKSCVKKENIDRDEIEIKMESGCDDESNESSININSLNNCINKIKSKPTLLNASCYYYVDDSQDIITNVNISPSLDLISVTNENSTIYLYKLRSDDDYEDDGKNEHQQQEPFPRELLGGHSNTTFKSVFTHDSKYLLSCGADSVVYLWDVNFDKNCDNKETFLSPMYKYSGHLYALWDVAVYSRLNLFATSSKDTTARLWSFDRSYPLRIYSGHQSDVDCVAFHPNGAYLATGSSDRTVRFWEVQSADCRRLFTGHSSRIFSLSFSPDGKYLASAGEDKSIRIWDISNGKLFKELKGHTDTIYALSFDDSSSILCSGGLDKSIKFWDINKEATITNDYNESIENKSNSNELICNVDISFNIYSIYCDMQNVFYTLGAKKQTNKQQQQNESSSSLMDDTIVEIKSEPPLYTNRKQPQNNNSSSSVSMATRRSSASIQTNNNNSNSVPSTTQPTASNSSYLFSNHDDLYEV